MVELYYERRGSGSRHLLFAHGWISSSRMWDDVSAHLDPQRFTQHRFDFRGCGRSDRPLDGHDFAGYAHDLRSTLAKVDGPVTLVAHSMGGRLAQFLAAERPSNLERMILVAPGTARGAPVSEKHARLTREAFGSRSRIAQFQRGAMGREPAPEAMERIIDDALIAQYEHWFGWYEHARANDFRDRLERIEVPVLVIAGAKDPVAPPSRLKGETVDPIAGAVFVMLKGCGHNIPVESPGDVVEAIERFT